jgi:hypothetical protein
MLILLLLLIVGCALPDYQLFFQITSWNDDAGTVTVNYELTNGGEERLNNARIRIALAEANGNVQSQDWTGYTELGVGVSKSSSIQLVYASGTFDHATVTAAGWDKE